MSKVIYFAPGLRPVLKHQEHDQSSHGNWAEGGGVTGWQVGQAPVFGSDFGLHIISQSKRASVEAKGLVPGTSEPKGVYTYNNAQALVEMVQGGGYPNKDIYKVPVSSSAIPDPYPESKMTDIARVSPDSVPANQLERVGYTDSDGVIHWDSVLKHQQHDQKTHGSWAKGSRGSDITDDCKSYFGTNLIEYKTSEAKREIQKRDDAAKIMGKGYENYILEIVAEKQGFDGKPKVLSSEEIDQLEKDGWTIAYRGIQDFQQAGWDAIKYSGEDLAEQFRTGNYHAGAGTDGDGIYFTTDKSVAESYAFAGSYSGAKGAVIRVAIPPNTTLTADEFDDEIVSHRARVSKMGGVEQFWGADDLGVSLASRGVRGAQSLRKMRVSYGETRIAPVFVIWDRSMLAVEEAESK